MKIGIETDIPPLMYMCIKGNVNLLRKILKYKPEINAVNYEGMNALHLLYLWQCRMDLIDEIAEILMDSGIDVNIKDNDGALVLHHAVKYMPQQPTGREYMSYKRLINNTLNIDSQDNYGNTPFHNACAYCAKVDSLFDAGANIFLKNNDGQMGIDIVGKECLFLSEPKITEYKNYIYEKMLSKIAQQNEIISEKNHVEMGFEYPI